MITHSAITSGGMRGLRDIADGCVLGAKEARKKKHRFIQPDNSFGTWFNIIEAPQELDNFVGRRDIFTIETKQENRLHLSKEDVIEHYKKNGVEECESWYITPVGNPSGTKMNREQLKSTLEAIYQHNPNAVIILDSVYVRTLTRQAAKDLYSPLANNKDLLKNIIFLESFSKSHGVCRERLGLYFSINPSLFARLHTTNNGFSAGPGVFKDFQMLALGNLRLKENTADKKAIDEMHAFWQRERKGLYNYLRKKNKEKGYSLFEEKQIHVTDEEINQPLGLYLLLKAKEGANAQKVFIETGVLGVDTKLKSGLYVRFSVGKLGEPVFSKYL